MALNYRFPYGTRERDLAIRSDNGCRMTSRRHDQGAVRLWYNPRTDGL